MPRQTHAVSDAIILIISQNPNITEPAASDTIDNDTNSHAVKRKAEEQLDPYDEDGAEQGQSCLEFSTRAISPRNLPGTKISMEELQKQHTGAR